MLELGTYTFDFNSLLLVIILDTLNSLKNKIISSSFFYFSKKKFKKNILN